MTKNSALKNLELNPSDASVMIRFVGELNENLKFVEKTFDVKICLLYTSDAADE